MLLRTTFFLPDGSIPVVTIINRTTSRELQFVEAKVGERVTLVCQISYKNFITDPSFFTLSLIWQKEGVEGNLTEKKPQYKTGNHTEIIEYRTTVGGSYHCQSLFSFPERKYERNASVELRSKSVLCNFAWSNDRFILSNLILSCYFMFFVCRAFVPFPRDALRV